MHLLLFATGLSFLSIFHVKLLQAVLDLFFTSKISKSPLRDEVLCIEEELSRISMVDEFPKFARLQRKLNALREQFSSEVKNKAADSMKSQMYGKLFFQVPFVCFSIYCFFTYRSVPVIKLPEKWLEPFPFPNLISWPSGEVGGVSFFVWFSVSTQVIRLIKSQ